MLLPFLSPDKPLSATRVLTRRGPRQMMQPTSEAKSLASANSIGGNPKRRWVTIPPAADLIFHNATSGHNVGTQSCGLHFVGDATRFLRLTIWSVICFCIRMRYTANEAHISGNTNRD